MVRGGRQRKATRRKKRGAEGAGGGPKEETHGAPGCGDAAATETN